MQLYKNTLAKISKKQTINKGAPCCTPVNNSPSRGDK